MDSKASIKIKFSVYGSKTYEADMYINYSPDDDGNDYRVKEWFRECYQEAYGKYKEETNKYWEEQQKRDVEKVERLVYERLKNKFEGENNA